MLHILSHDTVQRLQHLSSCYSISARPCISNRLYVGPIQWKFSTRAGSYCQRLSYMKWGPVSEMQNTRFFDCEPLKNWACCTARKFYGSGPACFVRKTSLLLNEKKYFIKKFCTLQNLLLNANLLIFGNPELGALGWPTSEQPNQYANTNLSHNVYNLSYDSQINFH